MARPISFRWEDDFIERIDAKRGDVPRSKFVRRAVEAAIDPPTAPASTARPRYGPKRATTPIPKKGQR